MRKYYAFAAFVAVMMVTFWIVVGYVAVHFIAKYW